MNNIKIIFCTFSDIKSANAGDAVNDIKLYNAISNKYKKITLFPNYIEKNRLKIKSLIRFSVSYLKENFGSGKLFITRSSKLAIFPILFKPLFKNKIIIRLGCGPLGFIENQAFNMNNEYKISQNLFHKDISLFWKVFRKDLSSDT